MLCDCPGLVFPTFMSTSANLVINGILPIDQLRDHLAPMDEVPLHFDTTLSLCACRYYFVCCSCLLLCLLICLLLCFPLLLSR